MVKNHVAVAYCKRCGFKIHYFGETPDAARQALMTSRDCAGTLHAIDHSRGVELRLNDLVKV